jgi:branched-chain amino acid transport system substrate-binding protein
MRKSLWIAAAAIALGGTPAFAEDVSVCIWGTITGPDALVNGMSYGTRDYFEFLNQSKNGIAGQKVKTLLLDGRYKLDEELKIYRRCVDQENAVFINGWSTGASKALRDQTTQDRVPYMSESYSSELLDPAKYPFMFIAGPTYEQQILIALNDLKARGGKKVVFMHGDNEYGRAPVTVVRNSGAIQKLGLELADTIEFKYDAQDLTAQVLRAKQLNPDMIYVQSSTNQTLVILRDAAKVGLKPDLFVGNFYNISPSIPEQLGAAAEGFRAIQLYANWGDDVPAMKDISAFAAKNEVAKKDIYYMKGWLEGIAMAAAIDKAIAANGGKVPGDLKAFRGATQKAMESLKDLDAGGIVPVLDYADHQGSKQARISKIANGKYVAASDWIKVD